MRKKLTLDLGEQHDAWLRYSASQGERPATLARKVLFLVLDEFEMSDETKPATEEPECGKRGIFVRLNADELAHLDDFARKMGKTRSKTIIGILRSAIASEPQFTDQEIQELRKSNFQLTKIGVNLNQITHKMNRLDLKDVMDGKSQLLIKAVSAHVEKVTAAITTHSAKVWNVINCGRYRWPLNEKNKKG